MEKFATPRFPTVLPGKQIVPISSVLAGAALPLRTSVQFLAEPRGARDLALPAAHLALVPTFVILGLIYARISVAAVLTDRHVSLGRGFA